MMLTSLCSVLSLNLTTHSDVRPFGVVDLVVPYHDALLVPEVDGSVMAGQASGRARSLHKDFPSVTEAPPRPTLRAGRQLPLPHAILIHRVSENHHIQSDIEELSFAEELGGDRFGDIGVHAGKNEPALRLIEETDDEPAGFSAYISTDGGANWCRASLLEPMAFCDKTTKVIVAFRNDTTSKLFLASFALMF